MNKLQGYSQEFKRGYAIAMLGFPPFSLYTDQEVRGYNRRKEEERLKKITQAIR